MDLGENLYSLHAIIRNVYEYTQSNTLENAQAGQITEEFQAGPITHHFDFITVSARLGLRLDFAYQQYTIESNVAKWNADHRAHFHSADAVLRALSSLAVHTELYAPSYRFATSDDATLAHIYEWASDSSVSRFAVLDISGIRFKSLVSDLNSEHGRSSSLPEEPGPSFTVNNPPALLPFGESEQLNEVDLHGSVADTRAYRFHAPRLPIPISVVQEESTALFSYKYRPNEGWWRDSYPNSYVFQYYGETTPYTADQIVARFTPLQLPEVVSPPIPIIALPYASLVTDISSSPSFDLNLLLQNGLWLASINYEALKLLNTLACSYLAVYGTLAMQERVPPIFFTVGLTPEVTDDFLYVTRPRKGGIYLEHSAMSSLFDKVASVIGGYILKVPIHTYAQCSSRMWVFANGLPNGQLQRINYQWPLVDISSTLGLKNGTRFGLAITFRDMLESVKTYNLVPLLLELSYQQDNDLTPVIPTAEYLIWYWMFFFPFATEYNVNFREPASVTVGTFPITGPPGARFPATFDYRSTQVADYQRYFIEVFFVSARRINLC
ncbi:P8 gene product [Spissistilus festinus reovirus]|uniref:P8 n=1 Tax=Spissistilus festinus reovirus TaxID=1004049 RepID=UPI00024D9473|nr:P8 gene product [Spissistilus festinus reovirus]AEC32494.1 P8 [Spissistilus festinus reovirus]